jgi:catechol-2,3-dioxygenase
MIDHLNAFVLVVRDVENCALFYRDKLGFDLRERFKSHVATILSMRRMLAM